MDSADRASAASVVDGARAGAGTADVLPPRAAGHRRVPDDLAAMRGEVERQRRELEWCRATIGELRGSLARAASANTAKADLFAEMSHELRTPLNAIIGFSEIMRSEAFGALGQPSYCGYLDDIILCCRHLLGIVDDTLDLARHERGQMVLNEEPVPVGAIIQDALRPLAPIAERAGVTLAGLPAMMQLPSLYCDRRRVRQILLNVLGNAVKFTEPGGRVEISADLADGLAIVVKDNGIGIEPDSIPAALSRFGQIAGNGAPRREGAGLGLAVAKALTERHGGTLALQSAVGTGTVVHIWFPAARVRADRVIDRTAAG